MEKGKIEPKRNLIEWIINSLNLRETGDFSIIVPINNIEVFIGVHEVHPLDRILYLKAWIKDKPSIKTIIEIPRAWYITPILNNKVLIYLFSQKEFQEVARIIAEKYLIARSKILKDEK